MLKYQDKAYQVYVSRKGMAVTTVTDLCYALQDIFGEVAPFDIPKPGTDQEVGAEFGQWLVYLPESMAAELDLHGYTERIGDECTLTAEMP